MRPLLYSLLLLVSWQPVAAQLASPGKLSRAHAELEGMRSCTRCHELRQEGISSAKCLSCHTPLRTRVAEGRGYHGRPERKECARCHQEHIGAGADIVRLDTTEFAHAETGWPLRGAHVRAGCRACHTAANVTAADVRSYAPSSAFLSRTFLGATTSCNACHRADSPHEPAIDRQPCERCHDESDWKKIRGFDHDRTAYPLTGAHRNVECGACHRRGETLRLVGLPHGACTDCHRDPHDGRFGGGCSGCHQTSGWARVPAAQVAARFDHSRTAFPLRGAHAAAACGDCHDRGRAMRRGYRISFRAGSAGATYPAPAVRTCGSCHTDFHEGQVRRDPGACDRCHGESAWLPVRFDIARHQRETRYPLEGAHLAVPCGQCHTRAAAGAPPRLQWRNLDCATCHAKVDPHGAMFRGRPCGSCHVRGEFKGLKFDHVGASRESCGSCHAKQDPHGAQFGGRSCGDCHATTTFRIARFDHARTRFSLEGAHARVACAACHTPDAHGVIRYRPLETRCESCHGGVR